MCKQRGGIADLAGCKDKNPAKEKPLFQFCFSLRKTAITDGRLKILPFFPGFV